MKAGSVWFGAVSGALACAAAPACAQSAPPLSSSSASSPPAAEPSLDPSSPMAELPGIGVAWPDLAATPDGAPDTASDTGADTGTAAVSAVATDLRYAYRLDGLDAAATPLLRQRFAELSALEAHDGDVTNAAQLDRRAREDADLLVSLLRGQGYYDAAVDIAIERPAGPHHTPHPVVVLTAQPGALYRFDGVTLAGVAGAGDRGKPLVDAFGVKPSDPVNADAIAAGTASLRARVGEEGFPFAHVGEPVIVVDRAARTATLTLDVAPGGRRVFGRVTANPDNRVFDARHVQEIARFVPGQEYDASALDDLRRALIQTGLVSTAQVTPVEGTTPGTVDVAVALTPAPPRTIAGELGYGSGEGARAEVSWTHRNLFPPEGALTLRGVLGTQEQLASVVFRRNNFRGRDRVLTLQVVAANLNRVAFQARTFSLSGTLERQTNIFFQKAWTWSAGTELLASDERDVIVSTGQPRERTFFIAALPATLIYDGSNDLLNPTRGLRLGGRWSPELSLQGSAFGYARVQLDASGYRPFGDRVVLAARARLGTIAGAPRDQIAPSRRFYAGGGASVRGYSYQAIGPRDANNDPVGGRSLTEVSVEARIRVLGDLGIVPFVDAGNIYTSALPKLTALQVGAGVGVRYYSNFGPIRIDVGTPLNPQPGDPRIGVYVSLGQAF